MRTCILKHPLSQYVCKNWPFSVFIVLDKHKKGLKVTEGSSDQSHVILQIPVKVKMLVCGPVPLPGKPCMRRGNRTKNLYFGFSRQKGPKNFCFHQNTATAAKLPQWPLCLDFWKNVDAFRINSHAPVKQ